QRAALPHAPHRPAGRIHAGHRQASLLLKNSPESSFMTQSHIEYASRFAIDPAAAAAMGTDELRHHFHIDGLFQSGRISLTYTHYARMIVGGAMPAAAPLELEAIKPTGTKN